MSEPEPVVVFRGGGGVLRSEFLRVALEEDGIPSFVRSQSGVAQHPFTVGPSAMFEILVSPDDAERARELLALLTVEAAEEDSEE